jgi:hypothetical protein
MLRAITNRTDNVTPARIKSKVLLYTYCMYNVVDIPPGANASYAPCTGRTECTRVFYFSNPETCLGQQGGCFLTRGRIFYISVGEGGYIDALIRSGCVFVYKKVLTLIFCYIRIEIKVCACEYLYKSKK